MIKRPFQSIAAATRLAAKEAERYPSRGAFGVCLGFFSPPIKLDRLLKASAPGPQKCFPKCRSPGSRQARTRDLSGLKKGPACDGGGDTERLALIRAYSLGDSLLPLLLPPLFLHLLSLDVHEEAPAPQVLVLTLRERRGTFEKDGLGAGWDRYRAISALGSISGAHVYQDRNLAPFPRGSSNVSYCTCPRTEKLERRWLATRGGPRHRGASESFVPASLD